MPDNLLNYYTFPDNNANSVTIPISNFIYPISSINALVKQDSEVYIRVTAGCEAVKYGENINRTDVVFKIWRGSPNTGLLICSAMDSAEPNVDRSKITAFSHVDTGFNAGNVTYIVTAEAPLNGSLLNIIGGLTVTVLVI